jgi:hypothetical protein
VTTTVTSQGATTIAITGSSTQTIKKGDVFTIADCFAVNPQTRESTGSLQQFVVTEDVTAAGGAYAAVKISPAIYTSGQALATVDSFPVSGKTVTFLGSASTQYPHAVSYRCAVRLQRDPAADGCSSLGVIHHVLHQAHWCSVHGPRS